MAGYTSLPSLTDASFRRRLLPPSETPPVHLPTEGEVNELFLRKDMIESTNTSVTFLFFALWFMDSFLDSFLRTDRTDFLKNVGNPVIDLCQIYGTDERATHILRSYHSGLLKSQCIDGDEYPPFLFERRQPGDKLIVRQEFKGLHDEQLLAEIVGTCPDDREDYMFAVGLVSGNTTIGHTMHNVVFLREHNRIARILGRQFPEWDDERLFETARNITLRLLLKLLLNEYIAHISPYRAPAWRIKSLNRTLERIVANYEVGQNVNWMSIEFNLLCRWHSLVPDLIGTGRNALAVSDFVSSNNQLVIERGVESLFEQCSRTRAGRIGLLNTPHFVVDRSNPANPSIEERTITLMRQARLRSFNDYRAAFGLKRLVNFKQLTANAGLRERLETLYGDIDNLEWYVGIFAEDYPDYLMMGELLNKMVLGGAYNQVQTHPFLAARFSDESTFTQVGIRIIAGTDSLQQIIARNSKSTQVHASFEC